MKISYLFLSLFLIVAGAAVGYVLISAFIMSGFQWTFIFYLPLFLLACVGFIAAGFLCLAEQLNTGRNKHEE